MSTSRLGAIYSIESDELPVLETVTTTQGNVFLMQLSKIFLGGSYQWVADGTCDLQYDGTGIAVPLYFEFGNVEFGKVAEELADFCEDFATAIHSVKGV